jgi:hypothetical protein
MKMRSPSGDVLHSVAQIILPALNGLIDDYQLGCIHDHLQSSRLALRISLTEADLAEYTRLTRSWMAGYFLAGGKFNVRRSSHDGLRPISDRSRSFPMHSMFRTVIDLLDRFGAHKAALVSAFLLCAVMRIRSALKSACLSLRPFAARNRIANHCSYLAPCCARYLTHHSFSSCLPL